VVPPGIIPLVVNPKIEHVDVLAHVAVGMVPLVVVWLWLYAPVPVKLN